MMKKNIRKIKYGLTILKYVVKFYSAPEQQESKDFVL